MARVVRRSAHAGSWYTDDAKRLSEELDGWLRASGMVKAPNVRGIIAPHAGYSYSGRCAAYSFANIDPDTVSRVFILGPSHHYYTSKCSLTKANVYSTPLGDLPIDLEVNEELRATGKFELMDLHLDEAEHSMEMHLPYLAKVFQGHSVNIVPILVGSLNSDNEAMYGQLLSKYVDDPTNFFCVSSDFCHWGSRITTRGYGDYILDLDFNMLSPVNKVWASYHRFNYTYYDKKHGPIYKSIEALDRMGMDIIETGDEVSFKHYLQQYENEICGRHPISVFLHMIKKSSKKINISFLRYEQSSHCKSARDSSVSYASAAAKVEN